MEESVSLPKDGEYDVAFTDPGMPGLSGLEVINDVTEHLPGARFRYGHSAILTKPFKTDCRR